MTIQLVTANALQDGTVVFLASSGGWSAPHVADAATAADKTAADALMAQAEMAVIDKFVIGPYLIDAELRNSAPVPQRFRERIRADGPTIWTPFQPCPC